MYIQNQMIVIFGATGDLMKRKLLPALYGLYERGYLSQTMPIICVGRRKLKKNAYIDFLEPEKNIPNYNDKLVSGFFQLLNYARADFDKGDISSVCTLAERLDKVNGCKGNKLLYLATPPDLFPDVTDAINNSALMKGRGWRRVVYEKPFGVDLATARELNKKILSVFDEKQIFRIDHYLAKDLVENLTVQRFANSIFKSMWNRQYIDNVQITIAEKAGVGSRAEYYDGTGAIKDMLQNHILQILSLVTMDQPKSLEADDIRSNKLKIIKKLKLKNFAVGQYGPGKMDDSKVLAYRKEDGVDKASSTETFVAAKFLLDHKDWKGVPFYVRTGKRMSGEYGEINLVLKDAGCKFFNTRNKPQKDVIKVRIQPDQGISIRLNEKDHNKMSTHTVTMDHCHNCSFKLGTYGAYEALLQQAMYGDHTLFARWDFVESAWKIIDNLMVKVKRKKTKFPNYTAGSMGPKEADLMIKKDKREWVDY